MSARISRIGRLCDRHLSWGLNGGSLKFCMGRGLCGDAFGSGWQDVSQGIRGNVPLVMRNQSKEDYTDSVYS